MVMSHRGAMENKSLNVSILHHLGLLLFLLFGCNIYNPCITCGELVTVLSSDVCHSRSMNLISCLEHLG